MSGETANVHKATIWTPFNIVTGIIILVGLALTVMRFTGGLASVTNLDHTNPWGIWIGFDLLCGVALAAGGFTTSAAIYIFGFKKWHAAVRPAILTAFLGYALVVLALHYDVGRPWRLPYPIFYSQGTTSLLFEVGLCVFIYLTVLFLEFTPAALEWLGKSRLRNIVVKMTLALTVLGVILSTMHQSSLGALFTIAPSKLHPLWYSQYLPLYFFISAIAAGLSMVIFEGTLSHKYFHHKMDDAYERTHKPLTLGFAKACSLVLAGYFAMKWIGVAADNNWSYLASGYGAWFMVEVFGFVALPAMILAMAAREKSLKFARIGAVLTVLGIILNRFNISLIAFNYHLPSELRYFPSWHEIAISIFVVTVGLIAFKFIVTRMPVFYEHPEYKEEH
jgi:Ni/Fe-hydrogenase subunit HybB-like protein